MATQAQIRRKVRKDIALIIAQFLESADEQYDNPDDQDRYVAEMKRQADKLDPTPHEDW